MYLWIPLLAFSTAQSADVALVIRAQTDFDRVALSAAPEIRDTSACIQSQAALLPVSAPEEVSLAYYRKGFCELTQAALTRSAAGYRSAAADFQQAVNGWGPGRKQATPVSSGLRVLGAVARLRAEPDGAGAVKENLAAAVREASCGGEVMSEGSCRDLVEKGRAWLGWIAWREGRTGEAEKLLDGTGATDWRAWVGGERLKKARRYAEAVPLLSQAVETWKLRAGSPPRGREAVLSPTPDLPGALYELADAQFLAGDYRAALTTLDRAVQARPSNAAAYFLRGRAKELLGRANEALADYDLARRTAFASAGAPGGEGHYYRGVYLFRRGNYEQAEDEFAAALNFGVPGEAKADITSWWHMAAVAHGACGDSAHRLEESLDSVSRLFPKREAESLLESCSVRAAANAPAKQPK